MPETTQAQTLAHEIAKRKLAIGQMYRKLSELQAQFRQTVGCNCPVADPETGKSVMLVDHFEAKDQHWKQVPIDRFEIVLSDL